MKIVNVYYISDVSMLRKIHLTGQMFPWLNPVLGGASKCNYTSSIWQSNTWTKFTISVFLHTWTVYFELFLSQILTSSCFACTTSYTKKKKQHIYQLRVEMSWFLQSLKNSQNSSYAVITLGIDIPVPSPRIGETSRKTQPKIPLKMSF